MDKQHYWTNYTPFPSPAKKEYLHAPFGAGVYELKNVLTNELVYVGEAENTSYRMSSLLPAPFGAGTRNNQRLRSYVLENLAFVHYRTLACEDKMTAKKIQDEMITNNIYLFN